ncbi:MAG TPA: hypothetical protein VIN08_15945, partial [Ohtaekwangia sp.]
MRTLLTILLCSISVLVWAQKEIQKKIQTQFIDAENGAVIELPEGRFQFDASLWLDGKKDVT